jgi:hypothetical protein
MKAKKRSKATTKLKGLRERKQSKTGGREIKRAPLQKAHKRDANDQVKHAAQITNPKNVKESINKSTTTEAQRNPRKKAKRESTRELESVRQANAEVGPATQ